MDFHLEINIIENKEFDMVKKIWIYSIITLLGVVLLSGCKNTGSSQLFDAVKSYTDKNCEVDSSVEVTLDKLIGFEWDKALVFEYPTTKQEIKNAIGVEYEGEVDLLSGIIFVKNKKIVYDEVYGKDFDGHSEFYIYINKDEKLKHKVIDKSTLFECGKSEIKKNKYHYWLEIKK